MVHVIQQKWQKFSEIFEMEKNLTMFQCHYLYMSPWFSFPLKSLQVLKSCKPLPSRSFS